MQHTPHNRQIIPLVTFLLNNQTLTKPLLTNWKFIKIIFKGKSNCVDWRRYLHIWISPTFLLSFRGGWSQSRRRVEVAPWEGLSLGSVAGRGRGKGERSQAIVSAASVAPEHVAQLALFYVSQRSAPWWPMCHRGQRITPHALARPTGGSRHRPWRDLKV